MTINFAPEAEEDFAAVIGYLAERNPTAAAEFGQRIFAAIDKLAANEFEGTERVLTTGETVRSWAVPPYPFTGWSPDLPAARRGSTSRIARDLTHG